jgi:hypothetical protein
MLTGKQMTAIRNRHHRTENAHSQAHLFLNEANMTDDDVDQELLCVPIELKLRAKSTLDSLKDDSAPLMHRHQGTRLTALPVVSSSIHRKRLSVASIVSDRLNPNS